MQQLELSQHLTFWDTVTFLGFSGVKQRVSAVPCGVGHAEELPLLGFEVISGPKHTCQLVLLAVSLTFDSQKISGSPGTFTFC